MHTVEDVRELARMHGGRGFSRSSEKLNQLSECERSKYERDEFILLTYAPYTPPFGVALADVLQARKQLFGSSDKNLRYLGLSGVSAVEIPTPPPCGPGLTAKSGRVPDY